MFFYLQITLYLCTLLASLYIIQVNSTQVEEKLTKSKFNLANLNLSLMKSKLNLANSNLNLTKFIPNLANLNLNLTKFELPN